MAINVEALPWAEQLEAIHVPTVPRLPTLGATLSADVLALAVPAALAQSLGWRGVLFASVGVIGLGVHGHYRQRLAPSLAREAPGLIGCVAVAVVATGLLAGDGTNLELLLRVSGVGMLLLLLGRGVVYAAIRTIRSQTVLEPTLIIGAGSVGVDVAT